MAEQQHGRSGEAADAALAPAGRAPSDAKTFTWRALAICIAVAAALSVTTTLLLGGGFRSAGQRASGGCCGTFSNQVR